MKGSKVYGWAAGAYHEEAADDQVLKGLKVLGLALAAGVHDQRHLVRQLEGGALKLHVAARGDLKDEPKVDVHQVALPVDEDVAIVAVLGLQQIAGHCIPALGQFPSVA